MSVDVACEEEGGITKGGRGGREGVCMRGRVKAGAAGKRPLADEDLHVVLLFCVHAACCVRG